MQAEAADRLRVSKTTLVTKLQREPDFPVVQLPGMSRVLYDADLLGAWIEKHTNGTLSQDSSATKEGVAS